MSMSKGCQSNTLKFQPKNSAFYNWTRVDSVRIWKWAHNNSIHIIRLAPSVMHPWCLVITM